MPQKAGLTGLMYGFAGSLAYLLLRDVLEILTDSAFLGFITLAIHASFLLVAPYFLQFKKSDCELPTEDEDPEIATKLLKMKLGGGFACCAALSSLFLPLYTLTQIIVGGLYIYLVFVRYKDGGGEDADDKFKKMSDDQEALRARAAETGAKALGKIQAY